MIRCLIIAFLEWQVLTSFKKLGIDLRGIMKGKKNPKKFNKKPSPKILSDKKSEHKKKEEQLRLLTEKLAAEKEIAQQYLDIAGVMLVVIGSDQKVKLANKKACQTLGYTEKQVTGSNWFDKFIPEHIRKNVKETFSKLMSGEITPAEYFENPILTKSGKEKIIAWHNTVLYDKKGTITGTLSSGSDITELKKVEESLIHSEEKYRSFFTSVPVGWAYCKVVVDNKNKPEDYIFLEVNNAFEELTGLKKENILGKKATKVVPQIKETQWIEKFGNVAITGKPVKGETYLEPFNKWCSIYVSCPQKGYFITVLEDINSRKKFEEALYQSEEKYRIISENIPVVVYSALPDKYSTNIFLSGRSKELTGYTSEELVADPQLWDRIIFDEDKPQVWEAIGKHRAKKNILHVEYRIICKNGSIKWIKDMATPVLDEQGNLIRIDGCMEDITERKCAEEALKKSEQFQLSVFNSIQDGVSVLDTEMRIVQVNSAMEKWYAHAMPLVGKKCYEAYHLANKVCAVCPTVETLSSKKPSLKIVPKIGTGGKRLGWQELYSFPLMDNATGDMAGIIEYVRDITERKDVEDALQESETKYRELVEQSMQGLVIAQGPIPRIVFANSYIATTLGYSPDELISLSPKGIEELIHPEDRSIFFGRFRDRLEGKPAQSRYEVRGIRKDGAVRWLDMASTRIEYKGQPSVQATFSDITERKQAEEHLSATNKQLENIIEFLPDATVIIDKDKKIIAWNRAMEDMTGVPKKNMIGKDHIHVATPFYGKPRQYLIDLLYMDDTEIASKYDFVKKKGDTLYIEVFTPALFNGKGAYVWAMAAPLYNTNGNVIGAIESIRDITERKNAEENLQKSEKQLQIIFETSNAGIIQINPQGKIILANKRMTEILGYSIEKLIGSNYIDCIHPSHKEYANRLLLNLISGSIDNINTERLYIREDGAEFWGHLAARRITESDGRLIGLVVIISDITEHKKLEEELLHSQKMEALGQLAGGVAHDFNNILNAIIGFGSLLKMKMKNDDPLKQHVEQILGSADRAAELTHNLLAFSRKETINFKPVELNGIIDHVEKFLKRVIGENIELTTKKSKNKLNILADAGHIEQVITNLATNARDAMPDGGQLIISSESIEIDRKYIQVHGYGESGYYAVLSVTDTGIGMSKEIQGKIFDPFFTTKEVNKGTGLGLAMVYGIVKHHKGFINVYSEIGKGTCFKIYLPLTQFEKIEKSSPSAHQSLFGTETVLMAEDDEYLRKLSEAVLGEFGYKVISAKDGEEAVEKFAENKDKIDICIFDIIMPKKSGIKAYEEIKKIKPDVKAFFISGYTSDFISIDKFPEKGFSLLPKPFKPHDLLMKIRETLDK
jgi:two-component system cell cycle sensor histidine kinase/response regulator CckA